MSILNNMPNVSIILVDQDSTVNIGTTQNAGQVILSKVVGGASTIGNHGICLEFSKNLNLDIDG